jgi:hypothetical protein
MPAMLNARPTSTILERIEEAIEWAVVNGIWIRCSEYGVRCVSSLVDVRWEKDPMVRGCSPLGAAVLQHQPEKTTLPEAAADALDISLPYEAGLADGLALAPKSSAWSACAARTVRESYAKAYEQGATIRIAILGRKYGLAVVRGEG